jgi:hypothetical protein
MGRRMSSLRKSVYLVGEETMIRRRKLSVFNVSKNAVSGFKFSLLKVSEEVQGECLRQRGLIH